jgi:hypothetical protein
VARQLSDYERFRREIRDLGLVATEDIAVLWRSVKDARDAKEALYDLLPELVAHYHGAAAAAAADFYDSVREASEASGTFAPILDTNRDLGTNELVSWALRTAQDGETFQSLIAGGVTKRIANGARGVVTGTSIADPAARGWMRIGAGECDFCAMLISRGAVYSEASVEFAAHDHDNCGAAPAFNASQIKAVRSEYVPSARRRSDTRKARENASAREWIAEHL